MGSLLLSSLLFLLLSSPLLSSLLFSSLLFSFLPFPSLPFPSLPFSSFPFLSIPLSSLLFSWILAPYSLVVFRAKKFRCCFSSPAAAMPTAQCWRRPWRRHDHQWTQALDPGYQRLLTPRLPWEHRLCPLCSQSGLLSQLLEWQCAVETVWTEYVTEHNASLYCTGVKLIFNRGHISLDVAFKGPK